MNIQTELKEVAPVMRGSKYTFYGVLVTFYDELFIRCNAKTRSAYNRQYNNYILPLIGDGIMEKLELEDYERVVEAVRANGLKPVTVQHYRYLIRTVVRCAVEKGFCQDVLFGSIYSLPPNERKEVANKKEFVRNKKSLDAKEEKRLFERIMTDPKQEGPRMGLALMFGLGLRNNEACGLKFRDIKEMNMYPGNYCVWVYETTVGATNKLKVGGKTRNAPRVLPIPPVLYDFLMARKAFLQEEADNGRILFSEETGIRSIEDLPIACQKSDYKVHCSSPHLTTCGRLVLCDMKMSEDKLAYIDAQLQDDEWRAATGISEKDPTAYLLRRNLATHLHILGLTESEIQYYMGHDMGDRYADRNEYTNEEHLYTILQKLRNRPLFNKKYPHEETLVLKSGGNALQRDHVHAAQFSIDEADVEVTIAAKADEPNDPIQILIDESEAVYAEAIIYTDPTTETKRTINVNEVYQRAYK